MELTDLFARMSPSVVGFITRLSTGPTKPHFPTIFGTGFFVSSAGLVATNRHVIEVFDKLPRHPKTGESALAAILFLPGDDGVSWQMLLADVVLWTALEQFSSSSQWYGNRSARYRLRPTWGAGSSIAQAGVGRFLPARGYGNRDHRIPNGIRSHDRFR